MASLFSNHIVNNVFSYYYEFGVNSMINQIKGVIIASAALILLQSCDNTRSGKSSQPLAPLPQQSAPTYTPPPPAGQTKAVRVLIQNAQQLSSSINEGTLTVYFSLEGDADKVSLNCKAGPQSELDSGNISFGPCSGGNQSHTVENITPNANWGIEVEAVNLEDGSTVSSAAAPFLFDTGSTGQPPGPVNPGNGGNAYNCSTNPVYGFVSQYWTVRIPCNMNILGYTTNWGINNSVELYQIDAPFWSYVYESEACKPEAYFGAPYFDIFQPTGESLRYCRRNYVSSNGNTQLETIQDFYEQTDNKYGINHLAMGTPASYDLEKFELVVINAYDDNIGQGQVDDIFERQCGNSFEGPFNSYIPYPKLISAVPARARVKVCATKLSIGMYGLGDYWIVKFYDRNSSANVRGSKTEIIYVMSMATPGVYTAGKAAEKAYDMIWTYLQAE